jgi:hypothetical protein
MEVYFIISRNGSCVFRTAILVEPTQNEVHELQLLLTTHFASNNGYIVTRCSRASAWTTRDVTL